MSKILFLDRDGVVNKVLLRDGKPFAPLTLDEFEFVPGIFELCEKAKKAGFIIVIVTNQPDITRGLADKAIIQQMHDHIIKQLPIDEIVVCPHDDGDNCDCRKPKAGMLLTTLKKYNALVDECWMIGDRWRDVEAAKKAGVRSVWIDYGYKEKRPQTMFASVPSIFSAMDIIFNDKI